MICPFCGKENTDNLQTCNFCGGSLEVSAEDLIPEAQPVEPAEDQITEVQPVEQPVSVTKPPSPKRVPHIASSQPPPKGIGGIYGNKIWWVVGCFLLVCLIVGCGAVAWGLYNFSDRLAILHPATVTQTLPPAPTSANTPMIVPSLSPNLTPLSTLTFTPNPVLSTQALIYSDDFSNPESGWDRVDQADFYTDYFENAYRIIVNSDMSDSWANPDGNLFSDVVIEVDATKNGGPDDNDFGVICRYQNQNQFYYAVISSDGYFGITKVTSDSSALLGRDSLEFSDAVIQGLSTNHIRFDCTGNVLTLYVNGQQVDQQTDSEYTSGNVGLIAGTYDTTGTDILFDNFFVYQP
jgi:hypothetical protein